MKVPLRITILGCGASAGVPLVGCYCGVCSSKDSKDKRTRASILVESDTTRILIDTSPDLRQQCLQESLHKVDAILYTHDHADHVNGIDDVRSFNFHLGAPLDAWMNQATADTLKLRFAYAFRPADPAHGWFRPALVARVFDYSVPFQIGDLEVFPFRQDHGRVESAGFRIGDFAYSTDVLNFPKESEIYLKHLKLWVIDCLRRDPSPTHAHLPLSLKWIEQYEPSSAVLTHMSHEFGYQALKEELPSYVQPAYDGLKLGC